MLWSHIARRYMFSPKSHSVINIIASVSVLAVAVPTAAIIILMAMFDGLVATIEEYNHAVDADIEVIASRGQTFDKTALSLDDILACEGVEEAAPYIEQNVMIASAGHRATVMLRGIDSTYCHVLPIGDFIARGDIESVARGGIVLGLTAASTISAYSIDTDIDLYALNRKQISTLLPTSGVSRHNTTLGGIVSTNDDIDATLALYDLERAQQLLNYKNRLSGIAVKVSEYANIAATERALQELVGDEFEVRTRDEKNDSINKIMRMERYMIFLLGALIAIVAMLSIVGSVIMLITDKQRDINTLRAMGGSRRFIRNIFVGEGALLTMLGAVIGVLIGVAFCLGQQYFGWIKMPGHSILDSFPIELRLTDTLLVAVTYMAIGCIIARVTVAATFKKQRKLL